ncbi:MAG: response regulator transcription factor [Candidatus Dormibacteraceae bacterium]
MSQSPQGKRPTVGHALVIEADAAYRVTIEACARLAGCDVEAAPDMQEGLARLAGKGFDVVIWGVHARDSDSRRVEFLTQLRETDSSVSVIMADDHFEPAQVSYESGADHILPKPFVPGALVGAIKSALRKAPSLIMQLVSSVEIRGMVLDADRRELRFGEQEVSFTGREWDLLSILLTHPNRFLSMTDIFQQGWRAGRYGDDQVRAYVRRLRQKLEPLTLPCQVISQQGRGYCLVID